MNELDAIEKARAYFLTDDNFYGCSETTLIVLQEAYGLSNPTDSSPAMALNGGVAWSGGTCGAVTGAAIAVGRLAAKRIADHKQAKRAARCIISRLMEDLLAQYGHVNCRELIGLDISTEAGHTAFLEGKLWHAVCMDQIEFVLRKLVALRDDRVWMETLHQIETSG
jgi:C_GCAxxG_C_C family probable redox protein